VHHAGFRRNRRHREPTRNLRILSGLLADYVAQHWHDLDQGIWEVRGIPRAFVYSRAMCWVALDRACQLASRHGHAAEARRWDKERAALREEIESQGYDADLNSFTQAYGEKTLDSANLRLALTHFQQARQPQMRNTILTTAEHLAGDGGLLYRYRPVGPQSESSIDGLPGSEGAFLACTWWLIGSLCRLGEIDEAQRRFEHLLTFASPLGLYAEEVDPASGALLGNFPQAFTHIGLINAAVTLQRAQEGRLADSKTMPTRV
jgi:GH15 family glucan-1,4-alpha-glucosidase